MRIIKSVKRDITKRYNKMLSELDSEEINDNTGRVNCYRCTKCGRITKTIERVKGVTPFGIECPECGEDAMSTFYNDIAPDKPIEYEWVRPTLEECFAYCEKPFQLNFILSDFGLLRKKIEQ